MATSRAITDHEEIRKWAEARKAIPSCVAGTGDHKDAGVIRLDFPGYSGEGKLEPISWEEWFRKFDANGLELLIQDETASGEQSNFNKLVSRSTAKDETPKKKSDKSSATRKSSSKGSSKAKAASR